MKFKHGTRRQPAEYEKVLVKHWKENKTFEKSVEQRPQDNAYVFYDGPPFITGVPHHGTLLSSIVKDAVPRYWTMKGKRVERVWGWDCHGLPAEVFTEEKLGIKDKRDIGTKVSLEDYILTCRANMVQTGSLWEDTIDRVGRWVDFKGAYKTMDKDYMESVWWAFKTLYDKGKIYEGEKVLLYCTRDATPISKAEVAMDNSYQDVTDPSVYVKFRLLYEDEYERHMAQAREDMYVYEEENQVTLSDAEVAKREAEAHETAPKTYLLAWTTTPWTLLANTAVAINKDLMYAKVLYRGEYLIVAEDRVEAVFTDEKHQPLDYEVVDVFKGEEIRDYEYAPLFEDRGQGAHGVWHADYVGADEGTGIVHLAPAYGEEDFIFAQQKNIPIVHVLDDNGLYTEGAWQGQNVWEVNKQIAKELHELGQVWKIDYIQHSYPHCHRCHNRLMYRAHPSWFMDIDGQRSEMLEQNTNITWFPEHIKDGRFRNTVDSAPDWNLSRDRFWATAMPVWKSADGDIKVIGSYAELKELSGVELEDYHRPWVDDITFTIDGVEYRRIDKVLDCWFESGSMPFAQFHYPFENKEKFEANFPGDFIAEYVAQVRAWFYYLHAVNVGLFGKNAFNNVIVTGTLAGNDGRKMSKSFGNYTDPNELMDQYSADALRFLFLSSPLLNGEDYALQDKDVADVYRKLNMVWNMYDFFTMYAEVDGWEWDGRLDDPLNELQNPLDHWIVSRLHQLSGEVDAYMQAYDVPNATKLILPFLDDASNWYVRRSRKRFWKSDNDVDKAMAYRTLHYVLVQLAKVMAPFTPFMAEELYQKLTGDESVHLAEWPVAGVVDEQSLVLMQAVRQVVTEGLARRAEAAIKVRQPLASVVLTNAVPVLLTTLEREKSLQEQFYHDIIREELNVKEVQLRHDGPSGLNTMGVSLDTVITPPLQREGLAREVIRQVQNARKQAGLNVDDRIDLALGSDSEELRQAIKEHAETIQAETLAVSLNHVEPQACTVVVKIEAADLGIMLAKAA